MSHLRGSAFAHTRESNFCVQSCVCGVLAEVVPQVGQGESQWRAATGGVDHVGGDQPKSQLGGAIGIGV